MIKYSGLEKILFIANVVIAIVSIAVVFIPDMLLYLG
ncbi:hypothetical protein HEBU111660_05275 [Helicobacter burdigaliensis]